MRPYVICHMISSIDGRITTKGCPQSFYTEYQSMEVFHNVDAWMCGRISMEAFANKPAYSKKNISTAMPKVDFIAPLVNKPYAYAVAIDPSGKLVWETNTLYDNEHIISVLTEEVPDDYLAFLQSKNISYIFCGKTKIDLGKVLEKLAAKFKIKKLMLEGGGKINGSMLRAGLIDELSILVAPVVDGTIGTPTIFDADETNEPALKLKLLATQKLKEDILWLSYAIIPNEGNKRI
ncbi:dihydrofolate reductase family protein [Candidatus Protochlamydia sp. W-9]|uniref:dihydrofolate reductase family protein n=1 Tax=Candidatus Protochlamydia sp. W-9 TaxID=1785087 RepID=UPI00096A9204|nr:RibD family protein [Candidatus Protochlamydia sp. W-9]